MHHVVPQAKAIRGMTTPQLTDATTALPRGYSIQVVPLKYIAVAEMAKILEPIANSGNIIRIDPRRNLLLLAGDNQELTYLLETIETFDVDWLAGLSVGFFALKYTETDEVVEDLNSLLEGEAGGMLDGLIKIVPVASANGLLVVTPRVHYLKEVEKWINRLDQLSAQNGTEERLYVYRVKNGDAENLAELLNDLLKTDSKKDTKKASIAPGLTAKEVNTAKEDTMPAARSASTQSSGGLQGVSQLGSDVRIVADTEKNSLLVMATARDYSKLESVLMSLDIVPLQVHVEATIVEVTLTGDLQYGLQWFFKTHHGSKKGFGSLDGALDSANSSGLGIFFPGFNWSIVDSADNVRAVLSAFAGDTAVNVLSAPSVMVLDNHEATIQVGDQVPVATQQQQSTDVSSTVINSIQYRDTGVMLKVKPRVNPGGLVTMEINQEVSSVSRTDSSNLDSPTIQTRKIASTVAINSGESVVLGGLMRDEGSNGRSGVPVLYKLPLIGALFSETSRTSLRTELVVVLTPRVIESSKDARRITQDFRDRMQGLRDAF
jgi:general secretion pathway protein D